MKGIDIYNGTKTVDFAKVKAAGYDFAMIKASEGHTLADAFIIGSGAGLRLRRNRKLTFS